MTKGLEHTEIVVVGGGVGGLTLGLALAKNGISVSVIDAVDPATAQEAVFDGRSFALSFAPARMLKVIGLWPQLGPHVQPIDDILVTDGRAANRFRSGGASPLMLHFDKRELSLGEGEEDPLGYMVEAVDVRRALFAQAEKTEGLHLVAPAQVSHIDVAPQSGVTVHLEDGRSLEASLCIAADGKKSSLRQQAGIKTVGWSYNQHGIVTTVEHDAPHHGVAQEYFLPGGPFAILPLKGNRASLVWTEDSALAPAIMALGETAFAQAVSERFGDYLGAVRPVGHRFAYPLGLQLAHDYIAPRLALMGDAAHAIHPIAGQGWNLGLRDVAALTEVLVDARRLGLDMGSTPVLERYQQWRRFDNAALALATDGLNRLFANDVAPLRFARDMGLGLVNAFGPARRFFMRHAAGAVGDLPKMLRGEAI